jgi:hypothetical protein
MILIEHPGYEVAKKVHKLLHEKYGKKFSIAIVGKDIFVLCDDSDLFDQQSYADYAMQLRESEIWSCGRYDVLFGFNDFPVETVDPEYYE